MIPTIDMLLAEAAVPVSPSTGFDVGAALRRLAADAAQAGPTPDMLRAARAGRRLGIVARWILNQPDAARHVDHLAQESPDVPAEEDSLDVEGTLVFACLLYLTGHPESAQFWWQLAAGAGHRAAGYCLYLHHLSLGEDREATHWRHQVTHSTTHTDVSLDEDFIEGMELVARYVHAHGSEAAAPTKTLEREVDRLADDGTGDCIIVRRPDRQLAERLRDFIRP
ncbi:hypothetical protein [Streptomyces sp. ET3-23]|uniref:hypothetical protein n=1 Tax=Streptomyces sp. ET3-23 TaxID=2885643 RepID=UPI0027DFA482|nr:hypothetical protein [Streptomyces sp. ET3-23]